MDNFIKSISAFILALIVAINAFGNFIGIGDIIPTEPETTVAETTTVPEETTTASDIKTIADFVAFYNAETAKIAENGSYKIKRTANYTSPIDVGGATEVLNAIIKGIDENSDLNSVVGGFLGIGTIAGEYPDNISHYYIDCTLKAGALKEEDITAFSEEDGVYKFTLENATNPKKTNETAISRFTNDFVTHEEVVEGISEVTTAIMLIDSTAEYTNINVTVTVSEGKITDIRYYYDLDAEIQIKSLKITGTGSIRTSGQYSDIKY